MDDWELGRLLGEEDDWEWDRLLGEGSVGEVYLAHKTPTSAEGEAEESDVDYFAVKTSPYGSSLWREKECLKHFIGCPEIVQYLGWEQTTYSGSKLPVYILKLEYAAGGTLADLIAQEKKLAEEEAKEYLRMILRGLCEIHRKGFVHVDLMPQNILAFPESEGRVKLKIADFGSSMETNKRVCLLGRVLGTAWYMAPEFIPFLDQSFSKKEKKLFPDYHPSLDIWSLGCILVEMISGKFVWESCSKLQLVQKVVINKEEPKIPDELSMDGKDFIEKCFHRDPTQRWEASMLLQHPYLMDNQKNTTQIESLP